MLESAFQTANQKVHQTGSADPNLQGMGTTGVAVLIGPHETAWVAHIGDSRAYRLRDGHFEPVTEDHSWVVDAIHHGRITAKEAKTHPMRNVLMRSIGVAPQVEVAISSLDLQIGDRFLLCSDGLWGEVPEASIAEILSQETPSTAVRQLVDLANDHGGSDNVTVQVAELVASESESQLDSRPHQPAATTPTQAAGGLPSSRADRPLPRASSSGVGSHWGSIAAGVLIVLIAFALFWRSCS
jgi:protein phosphatase